MEYKQIEGYENYYVCNSGVNEQTVLSTKFNGLKWMKPQKNNKGYLFIRLCENGVQKKHYLHRLIAEAFVPNPDNKPCIDHIDCNIANNAIENLRWCTHQENMNNPVTRKRRSDIMKGRFAGENNPMYGKPRPEGSGTPPIPVESISHDGVVEWYESMNDAARQTGVWACNIKLCCEGKRPYAGGREWRYAVNENNSGS